MDALIVDGWPGLAIPTAICPGDTSQFNESTILSAIFDLIGTTTKWCFECGADRPDELSNTKLFRDRGWHECLIERNADRIPALQAAISPPSRVIHSEIKSGADLDALLVDLPHPIDLGVIDIDSFDYWCWHDLHVQPRVMVVEYWMSGEYLPKRGEDHQAGPQALIALARSKGYIPVCSTRVNLISVHRDA